MLKQAATRDCPLSLPGICCSFPPPLSSCRGHQMGQRGSGARRARSAPAPRRRRAQPQPARGTRERSWKRGRRTLLPFCCKLGEGKQLRVPLLRRWGQKRSVPSFLEGWLGGDASSPVFGVKLAILVGVVGL